MIPQARLMIYRVIYRVISTTTPEVDRLLIAQSGCRRKMAATTTLSIQELVFSSSAIVYGWPKEVPCTEEFPLSAGLHMKEPSSLLRRYVRDIYASDLKRKSSCLGTSTLLVHARGDIGEDPRGVPNNLMSFVQQVVVGRLPTLTVFGTDCSTEDGIGVRDYIHVADLADAHTAALKKLSGAKIDVMKFTSWELVKAHLCWRW